jgi:3-hydroxybutyryl-CoA dehydrogenase
MGHGIAQVAAMAGHAVRLVDMTPERVAHGLEQITANLDAGVARGKVEAAAKTAALDALSGGTDIGEAVADAGFIIEAIPERLDLKIALFRDVDGVAPADAIFATNTSSLSISRIQDATAHPARVLGLHFFNPVHINRLVEVIRGAATDAGVLDEAVAFVRRIGKEPVIVNDSPGFATSRLGVLLGLEAMRMVEEGVASAEDIDRAMELGYRHPMGPLRLTDLVGLDIRLDIARYLHEELGAEQFRPPAILEKMVAEGRLGRKSGQGFYTWEDA